ncbi:MAG: metal ABC transporter ATP-binding protein [Acidimicrobiia bacterium]|nr:metal ABC transporter ATP-binding protein [Acidimicrobiia bacterium]
MGLVAETDPSPAAIEAKGLSFSYGGTPAVVDVSLRVEPGEFCALVGPNGSGKSTLVRLLLGLLQPDAGFVRCLGGEPRALAERWRIGYVPQRHSLAPALPATVEEVVSTGRIARRGWWRPPSRDDRRAVAHVLEAVGLAGLARRPVGALSGGEQQRVLIAKALVSEPALLVLDEPVAGVDASAQRAFRDSVVHEVREHGAAVLLVTHELGAVAADLDHVLVMKQSIVFDGGPTELSARGVSLGVHADDLPLWLESLT